MMYVPACEPPLTTQGHHLQKSDAVGVVCSIFFKVSRQEYFIEKFLSEIQILQDSDSTLSLEGGVLYPLLQLGPKT